MTEPCIQQLVIERPGELSWQECRRPTLRTGQDALVRPLVVGRCDLDVALVQGLLAVPANSPLGHECIAEIVEPGDQVAEFAPGQRVIVAAQISCGVCAPCRRGHTGRCASVPLGSSFGMGRGGDFGGALADLVRVPYARSMLVPLPSSLDPVAAIGAADMALDAWRAVAPALQLRPGARVLIAGGLAAVIALYAVELSIALGASETVYWDSDARRMEQATRSGARCVSHREEIDGAFDIVVDGCGNAQKLITLIALAAPEALFTSVVMYLDPLVPLPLREMYFKGITFVTGRPNVRPPMEHVLALCHSGRFDPSSVTTTVSDFSAAATAWRSDALRVAVSRIPHASVANSRAIA